MITGVLPILLLLFGLTIGVPLAFRAWPHVRLYGTTRWLRARFEPTEFGLAPRARLDPDRAGPPLSGERAEAVPAVMAAARLGEWQPVAAYVEAAGRDWDERWYRQELALTLADENDGWLEQWRRARPDSCTAATVHALLLVQRAWAIRGSGYAHSVPANRMAHFRVGLQAAMDAAREAAALADEDPGPWVVMVTAARGLPYEHDEFQELWEGLVTRAPYHYAGHLEALQRWCAKWDGSDELMMRFAERAVHRAPAGSPLAGIYLYALDERTSGSDPRAFPSQRAAGELLESVAHSLSLVAPDDPRLPCLRHRLAGRLMEVRRYDAALEQFLLIGPWCGAKPWTDAKDPVAAFDTARGLASTRSRRG